MEKAVYWYQESATAGYASAQNMLGNCFYNGWGIKKDWGMAVKFFRMAAEQGDTDGQINLSVCYQYGRRS